MTDNQGQTIIIQNQNTNQNTGGGGCLQGCGSYFLYLVGLGIAIALLQALAPVLGAVAGLCVGVWIGAAAANGANDEDLSFKQSINLLKSQDWNNFKELDPKIKVRLYCMTGLSIGCALIGLWLGISISAALA